MMVGRSFPGLSPLRERRSAHTEILGGFDGLQPVEVLGGHSVHLGDRDLLDAKEGEGVPLECQVIQRHHFSSPTTTERDWRNTDAPQKVCIEHVVP